ncbi:T9SS type A sorting domain-containing protein [Epilithonimonas mollis]|uniref:Por secretion system C-terminal sorting domain-containing protein n=1 Tax=Epilithonimonas mollis TaxID=216903 RepID=A0A1M6NUH5_9FLAO|nr:T9SS type A sorting domain-containing protein [Epilithonimonas mollis]SHJ99258.1 Por secretion system C-terminal sorting domain-containing protein [Epilithonimonas mollis]
MKKFFTILAVSALAFTAQAQTTFTYVWNNQGFTNAQDITTGNIVAGKLTYDVQKNGASNGPKFYTANNGTLRMYSSNADGNGNSMAIIAAGTTKINSVKIKTPGTLGADNYAPATAIVKVDGIVVPTVYDPADATNATYLITTAIPASNITIQNGQTTTSAQIRVISMDVTYTEGLAVSDVVKANSTLVKNTVVGESIAFAKTADIQIVNAAGQVVKSAKVTEGTTLNVSSLAKGVYIVTGTVNGEKVSQKVIKN